MNIKEQFSLHRQSRTQARILLEEYQALNLAGKPAEKPLHREVDGTPSPRRETSGDERTKRGPAERPNTMQFNFRGNTDIFNQLVGRYKASFCKAKQRLQEEARKQSERRSCERDSESPWLRVDVKKHLRQGKEVGSQLSDSGPPDLDNSIRIMKMKQPPRASQEKKRDVHRSAGSDLGKDSQRFNRTICQYSMEKLPANASQTQNKFFSTRIPQKQPPSRNATLKQSHTDCKASQLDSTINDSFRSVQVGDSYWA